MLVRMCSEESSKVREYTISNLTNKIRRWMVIDGEKRRGTVLSR
jgi:hypothetical protein